MTKHEALVAARNLIADEENWCRGWGHDGKRCAIHAVDTVTGSVPSWGPLALSAIDQIAAAIGCHPEASDVGNWNDSHTHAEVLAAFDEAIARSAPEPDVEFVNRHAEQIAALTS